MKKKKYIDVSHDPSFNKISKRHAYSFDARFREANKANLEEVLKETKRRFIDIPQKPQELLALEPKTTLSEKEARRIRRLKRKARRERRRLRNLGLLNPIKVKRKKFERPDYEQYIKSKEWLRRRKEYWAKFGRDCKACGSLENQNVHHMHYGYLGRERDEDIIGLCSLCHNEFHGIHGTKTVMVEQTLEFIETKQFSLKCKTLL